MLTRRDLLQTILALAGCWASAPLTARTTSQDDAGVPFSYAWLRQEASRLARAPYKAPAENLPSWVTDLDWDAYQSIRFDPQQALWRTEGQPFQARLFHLGLYFKHAVQIHEVVDGLARPIHYSAGLFNYGERVDRPERLEDIGFAGFRVHVGPDFERDMFSFLGASYFRAVGGTKQYGLSARGLAIDTGLAHPEEFPEFRQFWLERPGSESTGVTVYALLDSPSVAGAYRFVVRPGDTTVMDIGASLFPRRAVERLGIAPLTSMYQYGENDKRVSDDFRPEIHDSDGLSIHTGSDEWIWRPLVNSPVLRANSFLDRNPKGFGLLQRDRNFDHYLDDGAMYHLRPSVWVEPIGDWGEGAVQLVEIPTADETFDNIVVFWNPAAGFVPGQEQRFSYRLYWGNEPPARGPGAEVTSTRIGAGGIPGQKNRPSSRKFVIDFVGGRLDQLAPDTRVTPVISVSRGHLSDPAARPLKGTNAWRCNFDLLSDGQEPVDLRCYLRDEQGALTETWLYQWTPPRA
jgi:periplasmic glucans biosynthesis protein